MKQIVFVPLRIIRFIFLSLTPLAVVVSVLVVIGSSLIIYDQIQTHRERHLGAELIRNLKLDSSCSTIVNAAEKFDLVFTLTNSNNVPINFKTLQVDKSLLGVEEKQFMDLVATDPSFSGTGRENGQPVYYFKDASIGGKSKLPISLTLQAKGRSEAGANPHTIVIYKGKISFDFEHEMTIQTPCEIQIRYAE